MNGAGSKPDGPLVDFFKNYFNLLMFYLFCFNRFISVYVFIIFVSMIFFQYSDFFLYPFVLSCIFFLSSLVNLYFQHVF